MYINFIRKMFQIIRGRGKELQATRNSTIYLFETLKYLGITPPVSKWRAIYYLWSAFMNITVLVLTPISFILSYILNYKQLTMEQLLTSLQAAINVFGLPIKVLTIAFSVKRLRRAEDLMNILDGRCELKYELNKIHDCVMIGNRLTMFYLCFFILYTLLTTLAALVMNQVPYSLFMPFICSEESIVEFAVQSFVECVLVCAICCHQAADDSYAVIYVYILRTHMQILVERVIRLGENLKKSHDEHYDELVLCIKDHQNLISLLDTVSPVISITIFVQLTITAVVLGLTLINILIFADTAAQIASVIYLLAVLVQSAPCCYQATCLMDDSNKLALAIFHCNWIEKDKRFRKMLIFFMLRAQKPIMLTAMKLFPIQLDTSISIAKFSFSLYTLIKKMEFGQNLK